MVYRASALPGEYANLLLLGWRAEKDCLWNPVGRARVCGAQWYDSVQQPEDSPRH